MPRTTRASRGGHCYHALNCGNRHAAVFHSGDDYAACKALLRRACACLPMRLLAYCLMPNHIHLVLWPCGDGDLGLWMQWMLTAHVRDYRQVHNGSGHAWPLAYGTSETIVKALLTPNGGGVVPEF